MKLKIIFALGLGLLLCGCRAHYPVAQQSGKDDVAYLVKKNMQKNMLQLL